MYQPIWPPIKGFRDINFGLERVFNLLARLDNPHLKLPPTIHIAGTNGKGSTLAFLQKIFEEHNYVVHKYISPHLVRFNERIIIQGQEIEDDLLDDCLKKCKYAAEINPKIEVTFFEGITVAAFLAFSKFKADILLLETGMGGELDATNVLSNVLCSIITPISFDHQNYLGNSIKKIAQAKAGIIKNNCPVITYQKYTEALEVIKKVAIQKNSIVKIVKNHQEKYQADFIVKFDKEEDKWQLIADKKIYNLSKPKFLIGDFQFFNASLAILTILTIKNYFKFSFNKVNEAIIKATWLGRMQEIKDGKLYKILPNSCKLIIDGGHNNDAANEIKNYLSHYKSVKKIIIFAMLEDKDCQSFINQIANEVDFFIACSISNEKFCKETAKIAKIAKNSSIKYIYEANELLQAISLAGKIAKQQSQQSLILICGSLYFIGEFLAKN